MEQHVWRGWLSRLASDLPEGLAALRDVARWELAQNGVDARLVEHEDWGDDYCLTGDCIEGGPTGLLYGAYACLLARAAGQPLPKGRQHPFYPLRMLNCWDNTDGTVERGYSGRSLWFEGGAVSYNAGRIIALGRLLASVGINALCLNNVNVKDGAERLIEDMLPDVKALADLLRPFGVRLMLSVDFAQPSQRGVGTADPLDEAVGQWWRERTDAVYAAIPDFAGFVVKADSEHRPGPFTYGRTHADGANMLARALRPHGGVLIWRAFVYNCKQDWRDKSVDRPMAAYETYAPLDGQFDDNVILQVKHGPYDFQVREPVSPLFFAMPDTRLAMEVQLAQEYTGQQIDLYAMPPMWSELLDVLPPDAVSAVAAVSNLGRDECMTGHPFAAVNLYGYGRFAWDPSADPKEVIGTWARLTYALPETQYTSLAQMLLDSRAVYEQYTTPLGLGWMVRPGIHYGPSPEGYEYDLWGTYHRADRNAVGIDRTGAGTGYLDQYPAPLRGKYAEDEALCLFFRRLRYDHRMKDGRTLIQRIYDDHFEGAEAVDRMAEVIASLDLPEPDRSEVSRRMALQQANAHEWRDVINTYFHRLSGVDDERCRMIYD